MVMTRTHQKISVLIFFAGLMLPESAELLLKDAQEQRRVLQNTVQALLDFEGPMLSQMSTVHRRRRPAVSLYMLQLFHRFERLGRTDEQGHIVRWMLPSDSKPTPGRSSVAVRFDLNSIKVDERIDRAELHVNRHHLSRLHKGRQAHQQQYLLHKLSAVALTPEGSCHLRRRQWNSAEAEQNWLSWDVTALLNQLTRNHSTVSYERGAEIRSTVPLTIAFEDGTTANRIGRRLERRRVAVLLVYSSADQLVNARRLAAVAGEAEESTHQVKNRAKRSANGDDENGGPHPLVQPSFGFGPGLLMSRRELRRLRKQQRRQRQRRRRKNRRRLRSRLPFPTEKFEPRVDTNWARKRKTERHYYETSGTQSPSEDIGVVLLGEKEAPPAKLANRTDEAPCSRRSLTVRFRDIGWGEWIIAPQKFSADFCSGSCALVFGIRGVGLKLTNHAVVQRIVHSLDGGRRVPQVCCGPDKMDSLSLLYFDQVNNVVLKNFPKMKVKSCACL